jgi:putative ABC transport system permease protein
VPFALGYLAVGSLHVRSATPGLVPALMRDAVAGLDRDLPLFNVKTMSQHLAASLFPARAAAITVGAFGLLTLALATIGLYGLASVAVRSRTREMAIRLAVGGSRGAILRLVLGGVLRPVAGGLVCGLLLSALAVRGLRPFLLDTSIADPLAWGGALVCLALAAAIGALVPARRAASLDPTLALRETR